MTSLRAGVPTAGELRAIVSAYRNRLQTDADSGLADVEPNQDVRDVLDAPFTSVADTYERLERTEELFRERGDRRSVFLTVYTEMTATVEEGIESDFFADPSWVREYLVTFAEYYRRALVAFERRDLDAVPAPWRIAFGASARGETLVVQDALLGINAHINYDLTYALHEVSIDPDRAEKRADHDRINEILTRLTDVVQTSLVTVYDAAGVSDADAMFGQADERLALLGLEQSRQFAWRNAILLTDVPRRPVREFVGWRVRSVSTGAAYFLLGPRLDAETRRRLRETEAGSFSLTAFRDAFDEGIPQDFLNR